MNIPFVSFAFLSLAIPNWAESAVVADKRTSTKSNRWSVTGDWLAQHPNWKDTITIHPNGTFARSRGGGGKWRLIVQGDHPALELNWDAWNSEIVAMISPDLFRGSVRRGTLELRRAANTPVAGTTPRPETKFLKEFADSALKARLNDSVWQLQDGKQFTLRADSSTSGNWHNRKGSWRIVAPNKVQLTIMWRLTPPSTVTVESNGSVLRWSDSEWAQTARRVETKPK